MADHKLQYRVEVDGVWYGPDDDVPDDVAAQITNESAWEIAPKKSTAHKPAAAKPADKPADSK